METDINFDTATDRRSHRHRLIKTDRDTYIETNVDTGIDTATGRHRFKADTDKEAGLGADTDTDTL